MRKQVLGSLMLLGAGLCPLQAQEVRTLPSAAYTLMKSGSKLDRVWISPDFDVAKGFSVGKVDTLAGGMYANTVDYFPYALQHLAFQTSPYSLSLTVVELSTVERSSAGYYAATMAVEGSVVDASGKLMMAFATREEVNNRGNVLANCEAVMDKIVWSISRDLGKPFQHALETRSAVIQGANPSGLVPPPPPAEKPLDVQSRLLRLDDLKRKGLITEEEYKTHKDEILKGL